MNCLDGSWLSSCCRVGPAFPLLIGMLNIQPEIMLARGGIYVNPVPLSQLELSFREAKQLSSQTSLQCRKWIVLCKSDIILLLVVTSLHWRTVFITVMSAADYNRITASQSQYKEVPTDLESVGTSCHQSLWTIGCSRNTKLTNKFFLHSCHNNTNTSPSITWEQWGLDTGHWSESSRHDTRETTLAHISSPLLFL